MKFITLIALLFALACSSAMAEGGKFGLGVQAGYGFNDAFKLGFGVRGGTKMSDVYLGGRFDYFLGTSTTIGTSTISTSMWLLGAEGGYDFAMDKNMAIRPYVGLGLANATVSTPVLGTNVSASASEFAFWPGVTLNVDLGNTFCGADANLRIFSGDSVFTVMGHYGWYF